MTTQPTAPEVHWLQSFLNDAVRRRLCTQIHCTTCGATDFRRGLAAALEKATGQRCDVHVGPDAATALAAALAQVRPVPENLWKFEDALRFVLYHTWYALGPSAERGLGQPLEGTWAGEMLGRMKAHHRALLEVRRRNAEQHDPERIKQRREEKQRLKQARLAERLARKTERDRLWYAEHGNRVEQPARTRKIPVGSASPETTADDLSGHELTKEMQ